VRRKAEKVFGVLAIVAGLGIIVGVIAGIDLWPIAVIVPAVAVIGFALYHYVVIRPAPTGVMRPEDSPPHDEGPLD
jgi:hypothetical protein